MNGLFGVKQSETPKQAIYIVVYECNEPLECARPFKKVQDFILFTKY